MCALDLQRALLYLVIMMAFDDASMCSRSWAETPCFVVALEECAVHTKLVMLHMPSAASFLTLS